MILIRNMKNILALMAVSALLCTCRMEKPAVTESTLSVEESIYGYIANEPVRQFRLKNASGMEVKIISYGATITDIIVPDRNGKPGNVVLGFDSLAGYLLPENPYFGSTIGRYANRIAKARFTLNGKIFTLDANNNGNMLHGGFKGFDKVIWNAEVQSDSSVKFSYVSPDGEGGFPGNLNVQVIFSLSSANELRMDFTAATDSPTHVNLTGHSYFNLSAGEEATILNHELRLFADSYTPVNELLIPTGEIRSARNTPFDFTSLKPVGADIEKVPGGYDHNFVLNRNDDKLQPAAELIHRSSGRGLRIFTTQPGIQFYSGNFLDGTLTGRNGIKYPKYAGLCLEPQHFPDSPNQPSFPSTLLNPGQTYRQTILYQFFTQ
ncbi:MAG: galactose mutarotase [Cyclobacteriaceae bacterium]|nr:galactose mutarotase [Cyclobacteriaceae bacterium]